MTKQIISQAYRLVCDLAPYWNKSAGNRFTEAGAKKMLKQANRTCPGNHTIEEIK